MNERAAVVIMAIIMLPLVMVGMLFYGAFKSVSMALELQQESLELCLEWLSNAWERVKR